MLKIAICEDNSVQLSKIRESTEQYLGACPAYTAKKDCYDTPLQFLERLDKESRYDIESCDHLLTVHTPKGVLTKKQRPLARLFEELEEICPSQFIRPYKGFIVNYKSISAINPAQITLHSGAKIPVSKRSYRNLQTAHFDYMFGEGLLK